MLGFKVLHAQQPQHKGWVIEFNVHNWFARYMLKLGWAAMTLPFFLGFCFVFYWLEPEQERPAPRTRVHEFVHVAQWKRPGPFYLQYWGGVLLGLGSDAGSYASNPLEIEAAAEEGRCAVEGMPEWA